MSSYVRNVLPAMPCCRPTFKVYPFLLKKANAKDVRTMTPKV